MSSNPPVPRMDLLLDLPRLMLSSARPPGTTFLQEADGGNAEDTEGPLGAGGLVILSGLLDEDLLDRPVLYSLIGLS